VVDVVLLSRHMVPALDVHFMFTVTSALQYKSSRWHHA